MTVMFSILNFCVTQCMTPSEHKTQILAHTTTNNGIFWARKVKQKEFHFSHVDEVFNLNFKIIPKYLSQKTKKH